MEGFLIILIVIAMIEVAAFLRAADSRDGCDWRCDEGRSSDPIS